MALWVVRNEYHVVFTDIFHNLLVPALLVGFWPITHCVIVTRCATLKLAQEVSIAIEDFLGGKRMDFSLSSCCVLLDFEEIVGLQQHEIDFLEDLKVYVNEWLLARLTFLEWDKVTRCDSILQVLEDLLDVHRLRVRRRREGHLEAVWVHQEGPVVLETFFAFIHKFAVACYAPLFDTVGDVVLGLLLLAKLDNQLVKLRAELLADVLFDRHLTLAWDRGKDGIAVDKAFVAHVWSV